MVSTSHTAMTYFRRVEKNKEDDQKWHAIKVNVVSASPRHDDDCVRQCRACHAESGGSRVRGKCWWFSRPLHAHVKCRRGALCARPARPSNNTINHATRETAYSISPLSPATFQTTNTCRRTAFNHSHPRHEHDVSPLLGAATCTYRRRETRLREKGGEATVQLFNRLLAVRLAIAQLTYRADQTHAQKRI